MEYKKKKNDVDRSDRKRLILIATVLVLVLIFGIGLLATAIIQNRKDYPSPFEMTARAIESTNNDLWILITEVTTEQFIMTSTARP